MEILQPLLGLIALPAIAGALSENRRAFPWRIVIIGLLVQVAFTAVFLWSDTARWLFEQLTRATQTLQQATVAGTSFVFGYLGGGELPFIETYPGSSFVLALQALPVILVISALSALLWHWRVLPLIIRGLAQLLERAFDLRGSTGLAVSANIFIGMVEAPQLIRPVFSSISRADLFMIMTCGMATVAGGALFLYASILSDVMPNAVGHLLIASFISVPATVLLARVIIPEASHHGHITPPESETLSYSSSMDAITRGTQQGLSLYANVVGMLIVLVALVYMVNALLSLLPEVYGTPVTLQGIFGLIFQPLMWLIGIPWSEVGDAGTLMGTKTVLNELVAYYSLATEGGADLSERSRLIMTYALSGFANFSSLGIMLGGLTLIAPDRRDEIIGLSGLSLVSGTLATCMTGAVVALLTASF